MLVAVHARSGERVEASKHLPASPDYRCPVCGWTVIVKPGRVVVSHFAHRPAGPRCGAQGESIPHMRAKVLLAQRFREHGYDVALEEPHSGGRRRVDVAVTIRGRNGPVRVAVEVQDSAIAVGELQRRNHADKQAGFFATLWVFTTNRLSRARGSLPGAELRLPEEVRYLDRRWRLPVAVLDVQRERVMLVSTAPIIREGQPYYNEYGDEEYSPDRWLVATRQVHVAAATFELEAVRGRYATARNPDYTAAFKAAAVPDRPWRISSRRDTAHTTADIADPTDEPAWQLAQQLMEQGHTVELEHLPTARRWRHVARTNADDDFDEPGYQWKPV
ncbi:competence protein CoiA family protein [Dactylosporangium sp. NBC_01737]|uniref:competence protein CoiA n=1 Tax=Dactylosporangium sp. NBC_01737 TaxID=2975959 RepID=UPI002E0FC4F6|nr:competence protein CoiA family protein [Dactylosporangium sp. NBC_01737]